MTDGAAGPRVLIVEGRFYDDIVDALVEGATAVLEREGIAYDRITVPGAFEIPTAIAMAEAGERRYQGYIALGCVIRGETTHYDYVCQESARKLMDLATERKLALGYGILTVETQAQAFARARREERDKGGSVAAACLTMMDLRRRFMGDQAA